MEANRLMFAYAVVFSFKNWIIKNSLNALVNWSKFFLPKFTSTKAAISFGDK